MQLKYEVPPASPSLFLVERWEPLHLLGWLWESWDKGLRLTKANLSFFIQHGFGYGGWRSCRTIQPLRFMVNVTDIVLKGLKMEAISIFLVPPLKLLQPFLLFQPLLLVGVLVTPQRLRVRKLLQTELTLILLLLQLLVALLHLWW